MRFLSNILVKAGLVVEGSTSVATLSGGLVVGGTTQAGFRLDVQGTTRLTDVLIIGSSVAGAGVIRNNSTDGSLVLGGSAYVNNSLPARTIIISTVGTYTSLTGAANLFVGRSAGSSVTSGANNVFIGKGAGMGVTTGGANVIVSSSDASNLPSNLTNTIHLVAGGGYRLNDASLIPTAAHVFIGGGFGSSTALKDFYFGQLPFTPDAGLTQTDITFYAPSGSGTDIGGSDFTIAGGRGTGAGTPGDVILATSTATTSGTTLQTLTTRVRVAGGNGAVTVASLSGSGTRMVVADSSGVLSTQAIQTISSLGGVATSRTLTINGTSFDLSADRSWTVGDVRTDSTYANPAWITSLAWSKITGTPSFLTAESDTLATVTGRGASTSTVVTFSGGDGNNSSVKLAGYNLRGGTGFHGFLEATNTFGSATNPNKYFRLDSVGSLQIVNSAYTVAILTLTDAGALSVPGSVTAGSFVRSGGTSSQFLKADGSVDTNAYITGNQSISLSGDVSGSGTTSISVTLANSGVTAGTYRSVTVDAKGRVTAGTNPTTLAGYGITDAASSVHTHDDRYYTETEINNFFSGTTAISGYNKSNWDTAFGWGNHGAQGYATQSFVTTQINNLVAGAPGLLDTLDELAAALGDDPNFATTVTTALSNRLRVDTAAQGLNSTQQSNGRTNLGLGSLATLSSVGNAQITDVAWSKVTGAPSFITGNQTITLSGDASGSGATAITVTLANSGVTAGTYTKVTVDAKGRVTSGTTLSAGDIPILNQNTTGSAGSLSDDSGYIRTRGGGTEANIDTYVDNGVRSIAYTGFSKHLLSWNVGGSAGTIQQEFDYGVASRGWRIRNRTDNTTWSPWGWVVMTTANQGHISGTIATQSWVQSQGYLTSVSDVWVNNSGDSMTGNLSFGSSGAGITWAANTDGASITFESTGDGASGGRALSNLLIALSDNGDEGLRVTSAGTELFYVNTNQIQYKGSNIWTAASLTNLNQLTNGPGYLTAESDTLATVTNRGNTTTGRINVRGAGNQSGGNILMGNTGNASNKWSYLTGAHYNADSQPQGFALIGGLSTDTTNAVVIGGNIYETNPATEIQFWTHTATTHNLGGTQRGVINSSGNWGIGTNTPQVKLDVNGHVGIVGSNHLYFGHTTTNIGAWTTRQYSSGSTHYFNAQTFIFNNEGYGSIDILRADTNGVGIRRAATSGQRLAIDAADSIWVLDAYRSGTEIGGIHVNSGILTLQGVSGTEVRLATTGNATWNGDILATRPWVQSQGYLTATNTDFTFNASLTLSTSWQDTGVNNSNLTTSGVYMITCYANDFGVGGGQYQITYTGTMYWFAGSTNNVNFSEIPLHHMGHADNDRYVFLRTRQTTSGGGTFLQIRGNGNNSGASTYTFTFKRLM